MEIPNDISEIAAIIQSDWQKIDERAKPYLKIMHRVHSVHDICNGKSAKFIINSFLTNARYWRGDVAKEVKKHLRKMLQ